MRPVLFLLVLSLALASSLVTEGRRSRKDRDAVVKPKKLDVRKITDTSFTVSWTHPRKNTGIVGYQLNVLELDGHGSQIVNLNSEATSYTFPSLVPGSRYAVEVRSKSSSSTSDSANVEVRTKGFRPASVNEEHADPMHTHAPPTVQTPGPDGGYITECEKADKTDLIILIDGSWSVGPSNFKIMQKFLRDLVRAFTIGFDSVLIGMAQYSDDPRTEFTLNQHVTQESLVEAINNMPYKGGNTATGRAIDYIREVMFSPSNGARRNVHKTAIIITDGESILDKVDEPARRLRDSQTEVFSIGVAAALRSELQAIASIPVDHHVLSVDNFDDIQEIKNHLLKEVCSAIAVCPELIMPDHGSMSCNHDSFISGVECTFTCDGPEYKLWTPDDSKADSITIMCEKGGNWDNTPPPRCVQAGCKPLSIPHHGELLCSAGESAESVCTLQCADGYHVSRDSSRTCQSNGKWSPAKLKCERTVCPDPGLIMFNGAMTCTRASQYASTCAFTCEDGFVLDGNVTIHCQSDGDWSDIKPICRQVTCPEPTRLEDGFIECSGVSFGHRCEFSCDLGFELDGSRSSICEQSGRFEMLNGYPPACLRITCDDVEDEYDINLMRNCTDRNYHGSTCAFECRTGYRSVGWKTSVCQGEISPGSWSHDFPVCEFITCGKFPRVANGALVCSEEDRFSSSCDVECGPGYEAVGRTTLTCNEMGEWDGQKATCRRIECEDLSEPENGRFECTNRDKFESRCKLVCDVGFEPSKKGLVSVRTCQEDGSFTDDGVTCKTVECVEPEAVQNGRYECNGGDDSLTYGTRCTLVCDEGYEMVGGDVTRTCRQDHSFGGSPPSCMRITCTPMEVPANGGVSCTSDDDYNSVCTVRCEIGFKAESGDITRVCTEDGTFSGNELVCERVTCGELPPPKHANVDCDDNNFFDSSCKYECEEGYEMVVGTDERVCQDDGTWTGDKVTCTRIFCPALRSINHGFKNCTKANEFGSRCYFSCDAGFDQDGTLVRECGADHEWNGRATVCTIVECPRLTVPVNGNKRCSDDTNYQSQCKFTCNLGYDIIGESVRTCLESGSWTGVDVTCQKIDCGVVPPIDNGVVVCSENNEFNSNCNFHCRDGYELSGSVVRTCQVDHTWSLPKTTCTRIQCSSLAPPMHGEMSCTEDELYGSVCTISCDEGYELQGSSTRECTDMKSWTGSPAVCVLVTCASLLPPSHGKKICTRGSQYGSSCKFICDVGFDMMNDDTRVCQEDGSWSGIQPECVIVVCAELPPPTNSNMRCSDDSNFGTQCRVTCDVGFELSGSNVMTCGPDGTWSQDSQAKCVLIECPPVRVPENGQVICSEGDLYGSECSIICDDGYFLSGSSKRTCRLDKSFSGAEASCILTTCNKLSAPDNGFSTCTAGNGYSSTCQFSCEEGFEPSGSAERSCQDTGTWTGIKTTCTIITCGPLTSPGHGFADCSDGDRYKSSCAITCDEGYTMQGSSTRLCQDNYIWSGTTTTCNLVECPTLHIPNNGRKVCSDNSNFLSTCRFSCDIGYTLVGSVQRTCMSDHSWAGEAVRCEIVGCDDLDEPENGVLRCSSEESVYGTKCRAFCDEGYQLDGSSVRVCQDYGEYDGRLATCSRIRCDDIGNLLNGNIDCSEDASFDSSCVYSCDPGYRLRGSAVRKCKDDSSWSGEAPYCEKIKCVKLSAPTDGTMACDETNYFRSNCNFACDVGFKLIGTKQLTCLSAGIWSDEPPNCNIKMCVLWETPAHTITDCPEGGQLRFGESCKYVTEPGYVLEGKPNPFMFLCNDQTIFAYRSPITPRRIECDPPLVAPEQGSVTCSGGSLYDSICDFVCAMGYELIGSESRTCQSDQSWSGVQPVCILVECPELDFIPYAVMSCTSENNLGSKCQTSCEDGYELMGETTLICLETREWDNPPPACVLVRCGPLPDVPDGRYTCSFGDAHDSVCTVQCNDGYIQHGSKSRTCLDSKMWSGAPALCKVVRCGPLDAPSHGKVKCSGDDDYRSECFFSCSRGFMLIGHPSRACQADGQWSHTQPTCQLVNCPKLFNPANGQTSCSDENNYNSICQTSCFDGFELIGSAMRLCKEDGTFSGSDAFCDMISCPLLTELDNGSIRCTNDGRYNSVCNHACNPGYQLIGVSTRRCLATGDWSNTSPACERVTCRPFQLPANGEVSCSDNYLSASVCEITCNECYTLIGSPTRLCRNDGLWSGEPAFCQVAHCTTLRAPSNGEIMCSDGLNECGSTCTFKCREGYQLVGEAGRTCQNDLTWSGDLTECLSNQCPPISLSNDVLMNCTDDNNVGSNCSFVCDGEGSLLGSDHIVCQSNTKWSGKAPACRTCKRAVSDVFFIIDGSWSVGESNFLKVKSFLKSLASPFQVGWDKSRFSVIQYSDNPRLEFALNEYLSMEELLNAIDGIPYQGGNTNTGQALKFSLYTALSPANGARPYVSKIALILTDGRSQDAVANPAHELRQAGVKVLAVGVGDADKRELRQIATPPYEETVYHVSNYDSIDDIQSLLAVKLCESEIPRDNFCGCPAGPPGPSGKPGNDGLDGLSMKGAKGDAFNVIHVDYESQLITAQNMDGQTVTLPSPDTLKPVKTDNGIFFPVIGPPGIPGALGPRGPAGLDGQSGEPGEKGDEGLEGDAGPNGLDGIPGQTGPAGSPGAPGTSGGLTQARFNEVLKRAEEYAKQFATSQVSQSIDKVLRRLGTRGPPGPPGPAGPRGLRGDKGPMGFEGPQGPIGTEGPKGIKGSLGYKGEPGDRGLRGPVGFGNPGPAGPAGPKGQRGKSWRATTEDKARKLAEKKAKQAKAKELKAAKAHKKRIRKQKLLA